MSAAVSAVQAIVKLHGLVVDRSEVRSLVANVDLNRLNDEQLAKLCRFRPRPVRDCRMPEECRIAARVGGARCSGNNGRWSDLCGKSY